MSVIASVVALFLLPIAEARVDPAHIRVITTRATHCPSQAQIQAALRENSLEPGEPEPTAPSPIRSLSVSSPSPNTIAITAFGSKGEVLLSRKFKVMPSECAEAARTIALLLETASRPLVLQIVSSPAPPSRAPERASDLPSPTAAVTVQPPLETSSKPVLAAQRAPPVASAPRQEPREERIRCQMETIVGSHIRTRVCRYIPDEEWNREHAQAVLSSRQHVHTPQGHNGHF